MNIAIIGTGNVGSALARKLSEAGHIIFLGVKDTNNFKNFNLISIPNISAHNVKEAVENAEVVIVTVPADATIDVAKKLASIIAERVIIDTTNVVMKGPEGYDDGFDALREITHSQHIVKCFNSTGAENISSSKYGNQSLDMFIAGGSAKAKNVATQLANDIGFEKVYDFGDDSKVKLLEKFALAWINLALFQKYGRDIGIKILKRVEL